jgi:hypothetical protein
VLNSTLRSKLGLKRLSWHFIFVVFLSSGIRSSWGHDQIEVPATLDVPAALDILRSQFAGLTSIDIVGTYAVQDYDPSIVKPSENPIENVAVHFREQLDRYWFEVNEIHGTNRVLPDSMIWAFNGTNAQYFDDNGMLSIKKGPLQNSTFAGILFHPLSGFIPFYPFNKIQDKGYLPRLSDFTDPAIWQKSVGQLLPAAKSFWSGTNLVSFECKADGESVGLEKTDLRVGLDPLHGYAPVIWERWKDGKLVVSSQVVQLGEFKTPGGSKFYFPKKTKFCWLKPDGINPLSEIDFELSSLVIGKKYTDDDFTLDPGTANLIFDMDAKKVMQVPK